MGAVSDPDDPRLADYATGAVLTNLRGTFALRRTEGRRLYGQQVPHVAAVTVTGDRATVQDCLDNSATGLMDAAGTKLNVGWTSGLVAAASPVGVGEDVAGATDEGLAEEVSSRDGGSTRMPDSLEHAPESIPPTKNTTTGDLGVRPGRVAAGRRVRCKNALPPMITSNPYAAIRADSPVWAAPSRCRR